MKGAAPVFEEPLVGSPEANHVIVLPLTVPKYIAVLSASKATAIRPIDVALPT